jgi:amino acid permease
MEENKKSRIAEISIHPFKPLPGAPEGGSQILGQESKETITTTEVKVYTSKAESDLIHIPNQPQTRKKSTIISAGLMMTNACLGTTIFTFAVKAKSFGLVWILVAVTIVGIINYWTIMAGAKASSKYEENDYSELTQKILGRKARIILNCILIVYSYACMMCFLALLFPLFGRFIQSIAYNNKYDSYEDFLSAKWGKPYIKLPFYVGVSFAISLMCLIDDINKLNFSSYIGVGAVIYTLLIITYQCHGYYIYYKKNMYIEEDKSTHANYTDFSQAFKKDLDFFKGMANLFCAYACHPNIFPVYAGFKEDKEIKTKEEGLKKMSLGTIFATVLTTALHIVSIVCSFLTNPITPEDLIIYRKSKDSGKDIPMAIAKFAVFISLIFTLPAYYFTLRLSVADSFLKGNISPKFNKIFTFCSVFGCTVVAIVYDKILNYLSYIGGFISVFICYLIPVLLYIKSHGKPILYWKNLIQFILAIILCIIGVTAGILTIIDDVSG